MRSRGAHSKLGIKVEGNEQKARPFISKLNRDGRSKPPSDPVGSLQTRHWSKHELQRPSSSFTGRKMSDMNEAKLKHSIQQKMWAKATSTEWEK
jgi:hypothetical protein